MTFGLLKTYLPDWEIRTLVGRELWDFLGDDPDYHSKLCKALREAAHQVLGEQSFAEEIGKCAERITDEFIALYGSGEKGVLKYLEDIF